MNDDFEKVTELYKRYESLELVASYMGISASKVRKMLITTGAFENETSQKVKQLYNSGATVKETAKMLGCSITCVNNYLPYSKGMYNSSTPSQNALKIRIHRRKPLIF